MKNRLLICTLLLLSLNSFSQSLVGTWKRLSTVLVDKDNVSTDLQARMMKAMPCASKLTYTFLPSGVQKTNITEDCQKKMASVASMYADTKYEFRGNTLKVFSAKKEQFPDAIYDVTFKGNTMIWTFDYTKNTSVPNPTKAKKLTIVHERI